MNALSVKQLCMASQPRGRQRQPVSLNAVYQKPVGGKVAFPMPLVVADKFVIMELCGKHLLALEHAEHIFENPHVAPLLLCPLVVLLELSRKLEP